MGPLSFHSGAGGESAPSVSLPCSGTEHFLPPDNHRTRGQALRATRGRRARETERTVISSCLPPQMTTTFLCSGPETLGAACPLRQVFVVALLTLYIQNQISHFYPSMQKAETCFSRMSHLGHHHQHVSPPRLKIVTIPHKQLVFKS